MSINLSIFFSFKVFFFVIINQTLLHHFYADDTVIYCSSIDEDKMATATGSERPNGDDI